MQIILERQNRMLLANIISLRSLLESSSISAELEPYRDTLLKILTEYQNNVERNLRWLGLRQATILNDIYSSTKNVMYWLRTFNVHHVIPILRHADTDRLCIRLIRWMHSVHPEMQNSPAAYATGNCSILPLQGLPIYYFPSLEQNSLLYLPLFFHEIGHALYLYHRREIDDLVRELRYNIDELLVPSSQRNDSYFNEQAILRQSIVDTWYSWIHEFYCDAVGLTIGGPSYLRAFSTFLSPLEQTNFYREPNHLKSTHPVTLLRIRFLVKRARTLGYNEMAKSVEADWNNVAKANGIEEDYHGYYDSILEDIVDETIENMLIETNPRQCEKLEANGNGWIPNVDTPVRLLNWSWQQFDKLSDQYRVWEKEQISNFLTLPIENTR